MIRSLKSRKRDVVVTGLGVVSPLECGAGIDLFWQRLCKGQGAIKTLTLVPRQENCCRVGGEAVGFEKFLNAKKVQAEQRCFNLFRHALHQAVEDAWCARIVRSAGIAFGTILGEVEAGQKYFRHSTKNKSAQATLLRQYAVHSIPVRLSQEMHFSGPCFCVNTTCSSSGDAVGLAVREIQNGRADLMIAGGADRMSGIMAAAFAATEATAKDGQIRPFDRHRHGFCISEGAGVVILEEMQHAQKRGAFIYCKVSGYGSTCDAHHLFKPDPEGLGLSRAIDIALQEAALHPKNIDYINAHGVGTIYNDASETRAIKRSFGSHAYSVPISSIKPMIGHTMGACSVLDLICGIKVLTQGEIPPTINYQTPDPACDLNYTPNVSTRVKARRFLSLSAGLGGQNCAIIAEKVTP